MDWAAVAEECGLTKLWTKCVREIAITLARGRKGLHPRATSRANLLNGDAAAVMAVPDGTKTAVHDVALLRVRLGRDVSVRNGLSVLRMQLQIPHEQRCGGSGAAAKPRAAPLACVLSVAPRRLSPLSLPLWQPGVPISLSRPDRRPPHLQDLTPRTQLAVMATLLASLRKVRG